MRIVRSWVVVVVLMAGHVVAGDVWQGGRAADAGRGFSIGLRGGVINEFNAAVTETTHFSYNVAGDEWQAALSQDFNTDDLEFDESHPSIGLGLQGRGRFLGFQLEADYFALSSEAVAQRDYYLSVDTISFQGVTYDNMVIPEGSAFSFDVEGAVMALRFQLTPFTFTPVDGLRVLPYLDAGFFGFVGSYDIAAGTPRGIVQTDSPQQGYVLGGRVSGISGLGLPEYGGGVELRLGQPEGAQLVLDGSYVICRYNGGLSLFSRSTADEDTYDLDHENLRLRLYAEFPLQSGRSWILGGQYQQVQTDGLVDSSDHGEVSVAEADRYDERFSFRMTMFNAIIGFRF